MCVSTREREKESVIACVIICIFFFHLPATSSNRRGEFTNGSPPTPIPLCSPAFAPPPSPLRSSGTLSLLSSSRAVVLREVEEKKEEEDAKNEADGVSGIARDM